MAPARLTRKANILYLDAYDSFSHNIIAQVKQCLDADVTQIYIDDQRFKKATNDSGSTSKDQNAAEKTLAFHKYLQKFDAVIAGPGPGWVTHDPDIGLIKDLWTLQDADLLPVLGICLGFQSMALAFGAQITRLAEPRHGLVDEILHKDRSIFNGIQQLLATQYHSLQVDIGHPIQTARAVSYPSQLWTPTEQCPELEPLAWDFDSKRNGAVLMASRHLQKPFWGVQFHPESICTNSEGNRLIQNWWASAQSWLQQNRTKYNDQAASSSVSRDILSTTSSTRSSQELRDITLPSTGCPLEDQFSSGAAVRRKREGSPMNGLRMKRVSGASNIEHFSHLLMHEEGFAGHHFPPEFTACDTTGSGQLTVRDVFEMFEMSRGEAILLESGLQPNLLPMGVGTGRYSIIGFLIPDETLKIHYSTTTQNLEIIDGFGRVAWDTATAEPWEYIKTFMQHAKPVRPPVKPSTSPFWGGLMGYATYEAGLQTINVEHSGEALHPDICFAYITRSVVFDHQVKKIYVHTIREKDYGWLAETTQKINDAACLKSQTASAHSTVFPTLNPIDIDTGLDVYLSSCVPLVADESTYCKTVSDCQDSIADGQSYELCLTSPNKVRAKRLDACKDSPADNNELSWKLYKRLTSRNPAPFSAYLRMGNVHILSSSPERYIHWDRTQTAQCRPIKGTVQKGPGVTFEHANAILSSSKERAENLMIVDLVRHQLHGVYGAGNVHVSRLMQVEEYETLWQLVTVVDAVPPGVCAPQEFEDDGAKSTFLPSHPKEPDPSTKTLGFDAFVKSLPAGSMTGAPKKRSCEILQHSENHARRGIYSGVLGYFDVGGGGDFSVVIRTAVKVDDPADEHLDQDEWTIGAGGAITSQSSPLGEYEEMKGKFTSTARAFRPGRIPERTMPAVQKPLAEFVAFLENADNWRALQERIVVLQLSEEEAARAVFEFVEREGEEGDELDEEGFELDEEGDELIEDGDPEEYEGYLPEEDRGDYEDYHPGDEGGPDYDSEDGHEEIEEGEGEGHEEFEDGPQPHRTPNMANFNLADYLTDLRRTGFGGDGNGEGHGEFDDEEVVDEEE